MYSLACIIYALVCTELPFFSEDMEQYFFRTCYEETDFSDLVWNNYSDDLVELLKYMFAKDPIRRFNI